MTDDTFNYRNAGVDIDAGNALVQRLKPLAARTRRPELLAGIGGFGGLFALPSGYQEPVLVSGTDGVGTKLVLALQQRHLATIGIDLVAMCANDILVTGAEPLFFLDYFATGKLDVAAASTVIDGVASGCELAGMTLLGGETAEMPGLYQGEDFDIAGFAVGVVERAALIDGKRTAAGDILIGLASSGFHSNGYSLIRRLLTAKQLDVDAPCGGERLIDALLTPTRIYVKAVRQLLGQIDVHAIAHITGGGLPENLPRVLPDGLRARVYPDRWQRPSVFRWLQELDAVAVAEQRRTFNDGIGLVLVVPEAQADATLQQLREAGETPFTIGEIISGEGAATVEYAP